MKASLFLQNLRGVYDQREKPKRFRVALRNFQKKIRAVYVHEELPTASPEEYPAWMAFQEKYEQVLLRSHLHAHYFELSDTTLTQLGKVYDQLVTFVEQNSIDVPTLEKFVDTLKKQGGVFRTRPVENAEWAKKKRPDKIPNYIQLMLNLETPQFTRRVLAKPEDIILIKRHGGRQLQLQIDPEKLDVYKAPDCPTVIISFWVFVDENDPSQKQVEFGTGYIGDNFPLEGGDIMGTILNQDIPHEQRLKQMGDFLNTYKERKKLFALLPPDALPKP